jgi:hypothetical protein
MNASRRLLTVTLAVVVLAVLPASSLAAGPIQPGTYHETDAGACTLNFVYDGGGKTYMGTAAHCVDSVGQSVRDQDGDTWGRVAFVGNADSTAHDYAFIEVLPAALARVNPAVKGHPSYPTGVTAAPETSAGDLVQLSGYGVGFDSTAATQEQRQAVLGGDDESEYSVTGPLIFGDSGGPLVHIDTGKALGIVSRLCVGVCTEEGPTVQGILAKAAARGFSVQLRTP